MGHKSDRKQQPEAGEKTPFLLRWPVIIIALLLAWPLGLVMLITKLIGVQRKPRDDAFRKSGKPVPAEGEQRANSSQKKKLFTVLLLTVLFLALGCIGISGDYLSLFGGETLAGPLLRDLITHVLFLLAGVYLASAAYAMLSK